MAGNPLIPAGVERLLIDMPSWIGDSVMATPVLRAARRRHSNARILALARPGIDSLLAGLPFMDEMIVVDPRGLRGLMRSAAAIRRIRPDAVVLLPNSFRSALAARLGGAPVRVGYARDGRRPLLTDAVSLPEWAKSGRPVSTIAYYAHLAERAFGVEPIDQRLELSVTESDRDAAVALLGDLDSPFAVLNPGGNKPAKRWPAERFARVGDHLRERHGLRIVINGSPAERLLATDVTQAMRAGSAVNLAECGISLGALKGIVARARLLVTNDTGTRHIAAALERPCVTLFGPTDPRWTPLEAPAERLIVADPFLPEELAADDHPQRCAIDRIAVSDVVRVIDALLASQDTAPETDSNVRRTQQRC